MYTSGPPSDELQRHGSVKRQLQENQRKLSQSQKLGLKGDERNLPKPGQQRVPR